MPAAAAGSRHGNDHRGTPDRRARRQRGLAPAAEGPSAATPPAPLPPRAALKTARPHEWIKNVLVFAGLLFSGQFNDAHAVLEATLAFIAFCAVSSAGYFINDLNDVELDRKHPKKRFRPIAAGELSESSAI